MSKQNNQFHSKKFDAAQKHFQKKEQQYLSEIRLVRTELANKNDVVNKLTAENVQLQQRVCELEQREKQLLELVHLTSDELQQVLKRAKTLNELSDHLAVVGRIGGYACG